MNYNPLPFFLMEEVAVYEQVLNDPDIGIRLTLSKHRIIKQKNT